MRITRAADGGICQIDGHIVQRQTLVTHLHGTIKHGDILTTGPVQRIRRTNGQLTAIRNGNIHGLIITTSEHQRAAVYSDTSVVQVGGTHVEGSTLIHSQLPCIGLARNVIVSHRLGVIYHGKAQRIGGERTTHRHQCFRTSGGLDIQHTGHRITDIKGGIALAATQQIDGATVNQRKRGFVLVGNLQRGSGMDGNRCSRRGCHSTVIQRILHDIIYIGKAEHAVIQSHLHSGIHNRSQSLIGIFAGLLLHRSTTVCCDNLVIDTGNTIFGRCAAGKSS